MKKSLFFAAAASALMLTACSSENDVVQNAPQTQETVAQGVGFDVYTQNATNVTRSGRTNAMNNATLQTTGFGVFAYQDEGTLENLYSTTSVPNFMWNQHVNYIANAWGYTPLKYWPNETANDTQSSPAGMPNVTDKNQYKLLSFFAYAPWVKGTGNTGAVESVYSYEATTANGIKALTTNVATGDPKITYKVATDPSQSVDLLWGVAPVGGISYTATDGKTVSIKEGMPLIDLKKPAVNTSMKFLFQHALARLGVKVVLAADQVSAGGTFDVANNKVTIEEIEITGKFGTEGTLNLNNDARNKANWEGVTVNDGTGTNPTFKINKTNGLAAHLCYDGEKNGEGSTPAYSQQDVTGVTTTYSDAIQVSNIPGYSKLYTTPAYSPTTPYFADDDDHTTATPGYATYAAKAGLFANNTTDSVYLQKNVLSNAYTDITSTISTQYPNATVWSNIYSILKSKLTAITAATLEANKTKPAYRKHGNTYYPTGVTPIVGDYVIEDTDLQEVILGTTASNYYLANANYFMVIPPTGETEADKTIKVKITYYVSTTDPNVANGVVYTKNEVEKEIVLPHLKNGMAYNLKLILGMTSVKLEAEAADWTTTTSEINLPQNTAE